MAKINWAEPQQNVQQPQQEESTLGNIGRNIIRTGARAVESVLGLPGDVAQSVLNAGNYVAPGIIPNVEQVREFSKAHPILASTIGAPITGPAMLPGSHEIRGVTKALTGEYLEPQGEGEQFSDQLISDFAGIFAPELALAKGAKTLGTVAKIGSSAAAKSAAGNVSAEIAKGAGATPFETGLTKFIAMSLPFGASGKIKNSYTNDYKRAEDAITEYAKNNALPTVSSESLIKPMEAAVSGLSAHKDQSIIKNLVDGIKEAAGDSVDLLQLQTMKKNIGSNYALNLTKQGQHALNKITNTLKSAIESTGKEIPGFLDNWNKAEALFGDYAQATKALDFVKKHAKSKSAQKLVGIAAIAGPGAALTKIGTAATAATAAIPFYEVNKFLSILKNSPQGRAIYVDMFKNALTENAAAVNRDANKLDKIVEKYNKKKPIINWA